MKRVLVQFDLPNMTPLQYDRIWDALKASGHSHPFGLAYHVGAPRSTGGFLWLDVWETEEHFNDFVKDLMPLFSKEGIRVNGPAISPTRYIYEAAYNDSVI